MNFDVLFNPNSVAVIGASANTSKWGNWVAEQVVRHKELRKVFFVNPRKQQIYGIESIPSIKEIAEPLDVAVVTVSQNLVEQTVDELLQHGTKAIIIITTGFSERNVEGAETEKRIADKISASGSILIGPNCAGVWDGHSPFHSLPIAEFTPGCVGFISQSGGLITDIGIRLEEVCLGFSQVVSIGNCAGVSVAELLHSVANNINTKIVGLYLENDDIVPYDLLANIDKPVIVMMPHVTPTSIKAARKHTNSNLRGARINYVDNVRDLIASIQALLSNQSGRGNQVMVVTDTGGMGILAAAEIEHKFLTMIEPHGATLKKLKTELRIVPQAVLSNPLDLIGVPSGFSTATIKAMRVLQDASEVHAIIMILFLVENQLPDEYQIGLELARAARAGSKPVVFVCKTFNTPGTQALLKEHMPVYRDMDTAIDMVKLLCG